MRITVPELTEKNGYKELLKLHHEEVIPFVQDQFNKRNAILRLYLLMNLLIWLFVLGLGGWDYLEGNANILGMLGEFGGGLLVGFTVLIPIHEGIHGVAYHVLGAPSVQYKMNRSPLYFYVSADKFVISGKELIFVALAPFVTIIAMILGATIMMDATGKWLWIGILCAHLSECAGDFALVDFSLENSSYQMYTYDDVAEKVSYFYTKEI